MTIDSLPLSVCGEYRCLSNLDLYNAPTGGNLATQAARGRQLRVLRDTATAEAVRVQLCEDDYQAWLRYPLLSQLASAQFVYEAVAVSRGEIERRLPDVMAFAIAACEQQNCYLWGGTVAPNYDCSGLMQAAFGSVGVWLPRDAYQQAAWVEQITWEAMQPGDLIFFQKGSYISHVALYLGDNRYIHSSGRDMGRDGIGIDELSDRNPVSQAYYKQRSHAGRVVASFLPGTLLPTNREDFQLSVIKGQ
ncbi:MAG: C40 family peptidase [Jaaginema sp. PMC 1079.18]|nr:C40 family peptidase [Jaaginema sp. PMC 1080.18]MEC4853351.1 C40 family peptidase [Jaaginema sp. PMC 1079.18]MEC4865090.1 C40 family peptidase [Jaaginema sp. PMC 1078.18]